MTIPIKLPWEWSWWWGWRWHVVCWTIALKYLESEGDDEGEDSVWQSPLKYLESEGDDEGEDGMCHCDNPLITLRVKVMMRVKTACDNPFKLPWEWRWWWGWRRRVICWTRCSCWWRPPSGSCSPPSSARLSPAHQDTLARSPKIRRNNTRRFRFPAHLKKVECNSLEKYTLVAANSSE